MENALIKMMGWRGTVFRGDPLVYDRWKWLRQKLAPGPLRTLDAGCGSGCFSFFAASTGNEVVGVDFPGPKIRKAAIRGRVLELSKLSFRAWDLRQLGAADLGLFDQILSFEVIEHIQNDAALIRDMAALLKPGGRLILTTPYKHYHRLWGDKLSVSEDGGHVRWGYTHEEMAEMLAANQLEVTDKEYVGGVVSQQLTNAMRVGAKVSHKLAWGTLFPFRAFQLADGPLTKMAGYPFCSIAVVARKQS